MRKSWKKPKLIVLVKGRADERVLAGCACDASGCTAVTEKTTCEVNDSFCEPCL